MVAFSWVQQQTPAGNSVDTVPLSPAFFQPAARFIDRDFRPSAKNAAIVSDAGATDSTTVGTAADAHSNKHTAMVWFVVLLWLCAEGALHKRVAKGCRHNQSMEDESPELALAGIAQCAQNRL